jgi:hypothetical protein
MIITEVFIMKVTFPEDCGNSPKNLFVKDFSIALASGDLEHIQERISDDIHWILPGEGECKGKTEFLHRLKQERNTMVSEMEIFHAFTHGKAGAVDGLKRIAEGYLYAFCDVYEFSSVKGEKISRITTYLLPK